jgi:hypothetical protein
VKGPAAADYLIYADESGNDGEQLQVLAGVAGAAVELLAFEVELRAVLARHGIGELKWAGVRTRKARLAAAAEFLELACAAAAQGRLWIELLVLDASQAKGGWGALSGKYRWLALYQELLARARRHRPRGRWTLVPDQRTGMPWKRLARRGALGGVKESSSKDLALIQLADLLAGMTRFSLEGKGAAAERAWAKRRELLDEFVGMLERRKLGSMRAAPGKRPFRLWRLKNLNGATRAKNKA